MKCFRDLTQLRSSPNLLLTDSPTSIAAIAAIAAIACDDLRLVGENADRYVACASERCHAAALPPANRMSSADYIFNIDDELLEELAEHGDMD